MIYRLRLLLSLIWISLLILTLACTQSIRSLDTSSTDPTFESRNGLSEHDVGHVIKTYVPSVPQKGFIKETPRERDNSSEEAESLRQGNIVKEKFMVTRTNFRQPTPSHDVKISFVISVPYRGKLTTAEVVKRLSPSIVQITTEMANIPVFNQVIPSDGVGSGVIFDNSGHILTNNHVISGAHVITVTLSNGERHQARVVGADPTTDTAVISIRADGLRAATMGKADELEVGEDVVAIGHALGLAGGPTVSKGVVSALGRSISLDQQNTIVDLIQTDASINPGNSGGALVNLNGEVVGINTAIVSGSQSIGFALNIDDVGTVAVQLIENGAVDRGFLGITPFNLTPTIAHDLGVPVEEGIVVLGTVKGSAADKLGLVEGDVIVNLGGQDIASTGQLSKFLLEHKAGSVIDLAFYRNGSRLQGSVVLGSRPT